MTTILLSTHLSIANARNYPEQFDYNDDESGSEAEETKSIVSP